MNKLLFLGNLGAGEIFVIALVVLLLFGGKKIPELMKGLGKGIRSFKEGMNNIEKEIENPDQEKKSTVPAAGAEEPADRPDADGTAALPPKWAGCFGGPARRRRADGFSQAADAVHGVRPTGCAVSPAGAGTCYRVQSIVNLTQ